MADLTGVVLKLGRATRLVEELNAGRDAYLHGGSFFVDGQDEPGGDHVAYFRQRQPLPLELGLLIGDALHNARSALDHLAWQLVLAGGGTPTIQTGFPIVEDAAKFKRRVGDALRGADRGAVDVVRALQPWKGGDDLLWRLHRLDIVDKHHLLMPLIASQHSLGIGGTFNFPGMPPTEIPEIRLRPKSAGQPLRDGDEVFRMAAAAQQSDSHGWDHEYKLSFELRFADMTSSSGSSPLTDIELLVDHAQTVAGSLTGFIKDGVVASGASPLRQAPPMLRQSISGFSGTPPVSGATG